MPTDLSSLVFDEIAMSYATHLRELEAARLRFEQQCDEATLVLLDVVDSLVRAASLTVVDRSSATSKKSGAGPYGNIWVRGAFAEATKQEKGSAVSFGLGHGDFWGDGTKVPFGLYPYLSFTTPKVRPMHRRIEANLRAVCPPAAEVRSGDGGVYLVGPYIKPAAGFLRIDNVEEAIGRLVTAFKTADEWMADAARKQD